MDATTKPRYTAQVADGISRNTISKAEAETVEGAIAAAWALNRYSESPVDIWDEQDEETGGRRKLGTLRLDWLDD